MSKKCLECPSSVNCCVQGFAFVGIDDAKQIKEFLSQDYDYFLDYSKLPEDVIENLEDDDPSLEGALRYSLLDDGRILRIKNDGKCKFLIDGKCSIYSVRPKICRIYPYWGVELIDGTVKVIEHDSETECAICDVDKLSDIEKQDIKKLFFEINDEAKKYKKNIKNFVSSSLK